MARIDILISSKGTTSESELEDSQANGGQGTSNAGQSLTGNRNGETKMMAKSVAAMQLAKVSMNAIKSTFDYAKSNYGNFTGDYLGQQKIDNAFSVASVLTSVGGNIANGAISGGPVGALVAAAVSAIDLGVTAWQNTTTYNQSILKANFSAKFNAQRIGTVLSGGNRS
ncbi:MAG: hypothetical protein ACI35W_04020 [Anaeroplasmataceae bacterium]